MLTHIPQCLFCFLLEGGGSYGSLASYLARCLSDVQKKPKES